MQCNIVRGEHIYTYLTVPWAQYFNYHAFVQNSRTLFYRSVRHSAGRQVHIFHNTHMTQENAGGVGRLFGQFL